MHFFIFISLLICSEKQTQKNNGAYLKALGIASADPIPTLSTILLTSKADGPLVTSHRN